MSRVIDSELQSSQNTNTSAGEFAVSISYCSQALSSISAITRLSLVRVIGQRIRQILDPHPMGSEVHHRCYRRAAVYDPAVAYHIKQVPRRGDPTGSREIAVSAKIFGGDRIILRTLDRIFRFKSRMRVGRHGVNRAQGRRTAFYCTP